MSDLISRQAAIDAIIADKIEYGLPVITDTQERDFEVFNSSCDRHAKILKELPSTQKTGKWIENKHCIGHSCSICGKMAPERFHVDAFTLERIYEEALTEFCPHCGADMRGEEE